jgi:DNA polymerase-1
VREAAERTAIKTPIQGTAADIIKIAMVRIAGAKKESGVEFKMLLQVHDERGFEVPENDAGRFTKWVCGMMSNAFALDVPVKVDAGIGKNWSEAH